MQPGSIRLGYEVLEAHQEVLVLLRPQQLHRAIDERMAVLAFSEGCQQSHTLSVLVRRQLLLQLSHELLRIFLSPISCRGTVPGRAWRLYYCDVNLEAYLSSIAVIGQLLLAVAYARLRLSPWCKSSSRNLTGDSRMGASSLRARTRRRSMAGGSRWQACLLASPTANLQQF